MAEQFSPTGGWSVTTRTSLQRGDSFSFIIESVHPGKSVSTGRHRAFVMQADISDSPQIAYDLGINNLGITCLPFPFPQRR